jgi:carotenoid cleavage dioxygenase-like enzyme
VKLDVETETTETFDSGGDYFGEQLFIPVSTGDGEDDGVVVTVGLDIG